MPEEDLQKVPKRSKTSISQVSEGAETSVSDIVLDFGVATKRVSSHLLLENAILGHI